VETATVADLVRHVGEGDRAAWDSLVRRYVSVVHAVCRCYRLGDSDATAVNQVVWLRVAEQLPHIQVPGAIGGWIAAVTRGECLRVLRAQGRIVHAGDEIGPGPSASGDGGPDPERTGDPRYRAVLAAYATLDGASQRMLRLLVAEPSPADDVITAALDLPVEAVGPSRDRSLDQLRAALDAGGAR
jgi:DNA-directed RNA polymerase specialized sigma24 family protein